MKNSYIFGIIIMTTLILTTVIYPCHALDMNNLDDILNPKPEKTVSMDFTNANLNDVLKVFSQQSGLNFVTSADLKEIKVNIYLDHVPVDRALERILAANNLTYEIDPDSNIFFVKKIEAKESQLMTRVYPLKFATVDASKLNNTLSTSDDVPDNPNATAGSFGITAAVKSVLSDSGKVVEDTRTNSLIVSDYPSQFPLIEQTITRLDVRVPQILIEAEIIALVV